MSPINPLIKKAITFATKAHKDQYRKGGQLPYISHPILVAVGVMKYSDQDSLIAAAVLHDTVEDCSEVCLSLLEQEFGRRTAELVDQVSMTNKSPTRSWRENKTIFIKKMRQASKEALVLIAVDKMVNMESYFKAVSDNCSTLEEFKAQPRDYLWYYTEVYRILKDRLPDHPATADYHALLQQAQTLSSTYNNRSISVKV